MSNLMMSNLIGQQFGNYRLMRLLGQGGFADTYLGEQIYIHTYAAIKVMQTPLAQDGHEGFFNEARMIAALKHPHIVHLIDFGVESSRNIPYLVMDYAPNGTLRQRHHRGERLPVSLVVSYSMQMASALQYAHDRQIIHRDVKPENMLVGANQEILLSDFGIAVVQSSRTQPLSSVAGTMNYMAPEQIQGKPMLASDQYALAVVIYEWLCGESPFLGSPTEIAVQQQYMTPIPLRQRGTVIPAAVEQVVLTALAKEPQGRFESVWAFASALEQASKEVSASLPAASAADSQLYIPTALASDPQLRQPPSAYQLSPSGVTGATIQTAYGQRASSGPVPTPSGGQGPLTPLSPVPESSAPRLTPQVTPQLTPDSPPFSAPPHLAQGASASQPPPTGQQPFPPASVQRMPSGSPQPRRPWKWLIIASVAALLLLLGGGILAYTSVYQPYTQSLQHQARDTAMARLNATATAVAARATAVALEDPYTHQGKLVLSDPLIDNSKGLQWAQDPINCGFSGGAYHVKAPDPNYWDTCTADDSNYSNFVFEAQMQIIKGWRGGIVFRNNDTAQAFRFYQFIVSQYGYYELGKRNTPTTPYAELKYGSDTAINEGLNQINLLAVVAQGSTITVYVNHQQIASITDSTFSKGRIGFLADSVGPTEVVFSNVKVWQL